MGGNNLYIRLDRHRKKEKRMRAIKAALKGTLKNTTMMVMSSALIIYPFHFPKTDAYFIDTAAPGSSSDQQIRLFSDEKLKLFFNIHEFDNIAIDYEIDFNKGILIAEMEIPIGFCAGDILIDTLEISYGGETMETRPLRSRDQGSILQVYFDWDAIDRFLEEEDKGPSFEISGKGEGRGISGLGERFIFQGSGKLPDLDKAFFQQMNYPIHIDGIQDITIPAESGEILLHNYKFYINGEEIPASEVEWRLTTGGNGIKIKDGVLTIDGDVGDAEIVLEAVLKSNKYFASELVIKVVKEEPVVVEPVEPPAAGSEEDPEAVENEDEQDLTDEEDGEDENLLPDDGDPVEQPVDQDEDDPDDEGSDEEPPIPGDGDPSEEPAAPDENDQDLDPPTSDDGDSHDDQKNDDPSDQDEDEDAAQDTGDEDEQDEDAAQPVDDKDSTEDPADGEGRGENPVNDGDSGDAAPPEENEGVGEEPENRDGEGQNNGSAKPDEIDTGGDPSGVGGKRKREHQSRFTREREGQRYRCGESPYQRR